MKTKLKKLEQFIRDSQHEITKPISLLAKNAIVGRCQDAVEEIQRIREGLEEIQRVGLEEYAPLGNALGNNNK